MRKERGIDEEEGKHLAAIKSGGINPIVPVWRAWYAPRGEGHDVNTISRLKLPRPSLPPSLLARLGSHQLIQAGVLELEGGGAQRGMYFFLAGESSGIRIHRADTLQRRT